MDSILLTEDQHLKIQINHWANINDINIEHQVPSVACAHPIESSHIDLLIIDTRDQFLKDTPSSMPALEKIRDQLLTTNKHLYILYILDEVDPEYWQHANEYDYRLIWPAPEGKLEAKLNTILTNCRVMHELKSQVLLMETLFDRSRDGIAIADKSGNLLITNHQLNHLFGYKNHELDGKNVSELLPRPYNEHVKEYLSQFNTNLDDHSEGHKFFEEGEGVDCHGKIIAVELSITELPGLKEVRYLSVIRDIRQKTLSQRAAAKQSQYDPLTQLPNWELLQNRLDKKITQWDISRSYDSPSLMLIDINRFKIINESLGRNEGDQLLVELSRRIRFNLEEQDMLYRIASDEFAVVLRPGITDNQILILVGQIIDDLTTPFLIGALELYITVSFGIAKADRTTDSGASLIRAADNALQVAKSPGNEAWAFFESSNTKPDKLRLELESSLFTAIENGEFELHYQPQLALSSKTIQGAEALLRWSDPRHGAISPMEFIPILEDTGLIDKVGSWVIQTACAYWKFWQDEGLIADTHRISVNVSPYQFRNTGLLVAVKSALEETGLDPRNLTLEITESTLMTDDEDNLAMLHTLKSLGITIALDDFGTGFSSLSYLTRFPIDYLKIDRSFLTNIMANPKDANLVTAIINMAHSLEMPVIAEGVDCKEQLTFLTQKGCDSYQGFYFSRPVNGNDFIRLINQTKHMQAC